MFTAKTAARLDHGRDGDMADARAVVAVVAIVGAVGLLGAVGWHVQSNALFMSLIQSGLSWCL